MNFVFIQEFSYDYYDKVKTTVKDKIEKINLILHESSFEAVETIFYIFEDFNMLNFVLFWMPIMLYVNCQ